MAEQRFFNNMADYQADSNASAERWSYVYDEFGRKVEVRQDNDGDLGTSGDQRVVDNEYDAEGRLREVSSPEGTLVYDYDDFGRKVSTSVFPAGADTSSASPERITSYAYDNLGRLTGVSEDLSGSDKVFWHLDSMNTSITD